MDILDILLDILLKPPQPLMGLFFLNRRSEKPTLLQFQKLCGSLNFLCKCVIPGRAFLRRLYITSNKLKAHHHVRITKEHRMDLAIWKQFLSYPQILTRPFLDAGYFTVEDIDMYSDASRNFELGFGANCGSEWSWGQWDIHFMKKHEPNIEYLELFGVTVAVFNWIKFFKNKRIILYCDNESVVHMINNSSSTCKNCMVLIRIIVFQGLLHNVRMYARHVKTKDNGVA